MILLPDITFQLNGIEHKLSIQDPYTLDEELIIRIYVEDIYPSIFSVERARKVRIMNARHFNVCIDQEELERKFNIKMDEFYREFYDGHRSYVQVGDDDRIIAFNYNFNDYLIDLNFDITFTSQSRLNRLISQGRISQSLEQEIRSINVSPWSISDSISVTSSHINASEIMINDNIINDNSNLIYEIYDSVNSIDFSSLYSKKYIHSFNYKPEYIKHYMANEDTTSLLLGAEIEVAGNDKKLDKEEVVKKCIQIMNGSEDDTENLIYSTHDGTVQIELDTMPCTLEFHKQMNYKEMFKYLDDLGYKGHDCDQAGLHIHANRSYLGKSELKQQLVISKILYILEKFNDEICVIARRNNEYSTFVGDKDKENSFIELYNKYKNTGKKVALNLQHKDTIEFRCFRSTLKYETFILTLEFVKDIIDYAKVINIEEIELVKWSDLMNTFSDELKEYYNVRLEKEKNKKDKKDNIKEYKEISLDMGNIVANTITLTASDIDRLIINNPISFHPILSVDLAHEQSDENINENKIYNLKKEIKLLKKKIKNCNNYMECTQLKTELSMKQKELKKLKRENRQAS